MANINLSNVFLQVSRSLKGTSAPGADFTASFLQACRYVCGNISSGADLATRITKPSDQNDTISLSDDYEGTFTKLVILELALLGQRVNKDTVGMIDRIERDKGNMIDEIRQDIANQAVTADDDDETDFAQLGALDA